MCRAGAKISTLVISQNVAVLSWEIIDLYNNGLVLKIDNAMEPNNDNVIQLIMMEYFYQPNVINDRQKEPHGWHE